MYVQHYEPRTNGEDAIALGMCVGLLCAPPQLSARLLCGPWSSPVSMPQDKTSTHLVHVLFGLVLGALAWMRVARRGGTKGEMILWSVFVALFGVFAYLFLLLLRPRPLLAASAERVQLGASLAATWEPER